MPKRSITSMGKRWEFANSLWMFWVLMIFGLTSWISFFYIGSRAKQMKWIIAGFIYLLNTIQFFYVSERYEIDAWQYDASLVLTIFGWIISVIHATTARREYLVRLEQELLTLKERVTKNPTATRIREDQIIPTAAKVTHQELEMRQPPIKKTQKKKSETTIDSGNSMAPSTSIKPIDVNMATVDQLAAIPSIGLLLAGKIVEVRAEKGGFSSFNDFVLQMNMKPHIVVRAKPYLIFPGQSEAGQMKKEGARITEGRIVDY